jgi:hypothetical protein
MPQLADVKNDIVIIATIKQAIQGKEENAIFIPPSKKCKNKKCAASFNHAIYLPKNNPKFLLRYY